MKVGAVLRLDGLEASRDKTNCWHLSVFELRQAGHTSVTALRAVQMVVPLIGHWRILPGDPMTSGRTAGVQKRTLGSIQIRKLL